MKSANFCHFFTARSKHVAALSIAAVLLSACAQGVGVTPSTTNTEPGVSAAPPPSFTQFADIPIPTGAKMVIDRTLILGPQESWLGRLVLDSEHSTTSMFDFYKQRTPEFGWQEVTSVRSAVSVLTYSRGQRVMTLQIRSKTIAGSELDITVSPRGGDPTPPPAPK